MKKLKISQKIVNRLLPADLQLNQDIYVLYETEISQFHCNNCGKCCNLRQSQNSVRNNSFAVVLCDLDINRLAKADESLLRFLKPATLRNTAETVILIEKIDKKCPFFDQKTNLCKIYEKRPYVCRVFPYIFKIKGEHTFQVNLNPESPCSSECFGLSIISPKEIAKIFIWAFVLNKRRKLGEKIWKKVQ
ncbi:MAG: YkgJ family cysteine cluster protein [Candidatus Hodarchaeota archaeon]